MTDPDAEGSWRWRHLLAAPHRPGFFLAMVVLGASALWWAAVQLQRTGLLPTVPMALPPSLVHGAVMTFGFFPLFFCGFLFTAGPRWLGVRPPAVPRLLPALAVQAAGWLVWLAGSHVHAGLAAAGLVLAASGLLRATLLFWSLVRASREHDRVHPRLAGLALGIGCAALAALAAAVWAGAVSTAHTLVASALWGFVALMFVAVGHRMIPFFGPPGGTRLAAAGEWSVLWLLAGTMLFEALAAWLQAWLTATPLWQLARAVLELAAGSVLLWLAAAWIRASNLRIRLLAMLHAGLVWIALALLLQAGAALRSWSSGDAALPLAGLHALAMGGLGSLMLAMVTRVSAAHAGRPQVADNLVWTLFWLLQAATIMRVAATLPLMPAQPLLTAASAVWAAVVLAWGVRYGSGYGRIATAARQR
ncbi:NnrS family protein [Ramlibacter sp. RBP-2]|uniref:NnrS family protein n=1 Tax=Ramlibacter lithotrophicus TaxID=2606681 RepID=A0A7X6DEN1_9BURK|nr:NnrS family protein [Ramlibacter lithotrophicus]NKE65787.1 NnrS family protein [Ramlibacter lithotrophicus]